MIMSRARVRLPRCSDAQVDPLVICTCFCWSAASTKQQFLESEYHMNHIIDIIDIISNVRACVRQEASVGDLRFGDLITSHHTFCALAEEKVQSQHAACNLV